MINKNKEEDNSISFISNNSQNIIDKNFCDFLKEECYKEIHNDVLKNDIFYFTSFINSCKTYNNISELKNDFIKIIKNNNQEIEYYYNIIYNYLNSISIIISPKRFLEQDNNFKELLKILTIFDKYFITTPTKEFENLKFQITLVLKNIHKTLFKSINYKEKFECIEIINNKIEIIEKINNNQIINQNKSDSEEINNINEENNEESEIIIHFDSYKNNNNYEYDIEQHNNLSSSINNNSDLNNAQFIDDNSIEKNSFINKINYNDKDESLNNNNIQIKKHKKKKKKKNIEDKKDIEEKPFEQISYNYENIMCPPIKSDGDSD